MVHNFGKVQRKRRGASPIGMEAQSRREELMQDVEKD
jgi:hypothetical protein